MNNWQCMSETSGHGLNSLVPAHRAEASQAALVTWMVRAMVVDGTHGVLVVV